jgi:hypothetical protein
MQSEGRGQGLQEVQAEVQGERRGGARELGKDEGSNLQHELTERSPMLALQAMHAASTKPLQANKRHANKGNHPANANKRLAMQTRGMQTRGCKQEAREASSKTVGRARNRICKRAVWSLVGGARKRAPFFVFQCHGMLRRMLGSAFCSVTALWYMVFRAADEAKYANARGFGAL